MKNFMLIKRVSSFLYVGYAKNISDIPRLGVEQVDIRINDPEGARGDDPLLEMRARCIFHLPHQCFILQAVANEECSEYTLQMVQHCKQNKIEFDKSESGREQAAIKLMLDELYRAEVAHPQWPEEAIHAACIVGEEAGELLRDCATFEENGDQDLITNMMVEATQTGAMALRFLKNLPSSQKRTIPNNALRSILDSDLTPEQQLIEVRRLMDNGVS